MPQNCSNISWTCLNSTPNRAFGSHLTSSLYVWLYLTISLLFYFNVLKKPTLCQTAVKSIAPLSMAFALCSQFCLKLQLCEHKKWISSLKWCWEDTLIQLQTIWEGKRRCLWGSRHLHSIFSPKFQRLMFIEQAVSAHCWNWVALPTQWIIKWVKLSVRIIVCRIEMPFLNVSFYQSWNTQCLP